MTDGAASRFFSNDIRRANQRGKMMQRLDHRLYSFQSTKRSTKVVKNVSEMKTSVHKHAGYGTQSVLRKETLYSDNATQEGGGRSTGGSRINFG